MASWALNQYFDILSNSIDFAILITNSQEDETKAFPLPEMPTFSAWLNIPVQLFVFFKKTVVPLTVA